MNIQIPGRIAAIGKLRAFSSGNSVTILLAESDDNTSILPIEFFGDNIQLTTTVVAGDKVRVFVEITGKSYTAKEGTTKYLAILRGYKIEPLTIISSEIAEKNNVGKNGN